MIEVKQQWRQEYRQASLEELLPNGSVKCHLSPRNCVMKEGQDGFCKVRGNRGGRLITMNYGKSVHATEETIETEAVNHFSPGERILSMGNIGCMMNCSYCHNWKTSQAKYVSDEDVYRYSPEDVVNIALRHGIRMISWTYNDPVVWQEFVVETAKLAKAAGLMNLYKSAFYITTRAVDDLIPYMDIFSVSVKSIDPEYYRKYTKGRLEPVLEATKHAYKSGRHLEISTLMITGISDNDETARKVTTWALENLDANVPMHFVRFHPDYRMRDSERTPIVNLERARQVAVDMGAQHVYLGNVYDTRHSDTFCNGCSKLLVARYGLNAQNLGLDGNGHCSSCGRDMHFKMRGAVPTAKTVDHAPSDLVVKAFDWHGDIRSLHVQARNVGSAASRMYVRRRLSTSESMPWQVVELAPQESYRFIVAKGLLTETGCEVAYSDSIATNLHEVFDRAHFPTLAVESVGKARSDIAPLPIFGQDVV
jgi:pyruvate formate lyase activating enzyme